jgi:hypothetical protein
MNRNKWIIETPLDKRSLFEPDEGLMNCLAERGFRSGLEYLELDEHRSKPASP